MSADEYTFRDTYLPQQLPSPQLALTSGWLPGGAEHHMMHWDEGPLTA